MITKDYAYKLAFEKRAEQLRQKEAIREATLELVYEKLPRLTEIDRELGSVGASLALFALSGKSVEGLKEKSAALSQEKATLLKCANVPEIEYDCPLCNDTGRIKGKICDCIKRSASKIIADELSRQMPLKDNTFENFDLKYYPENEIDGANAQKRKTAILKLCRE